MSEKREGMYFARVVSVMTLAAGSLALGASWDQEPVVEERVEAAAFTMAEVTEPTFETTTTSSTTTTTEAPTTTTTTAAPPPTTERPRPTPVVYPVGCELYRDEIAQYDWPVEGAMRTMKEESGCDPNEVSATDDYGLFQLHGERIYDPAANIARAFQKYRQARRGSNNFSAWYAVCSPQLEPKFPEVHCR